jgi:hypothetical protein
MPLRGELLNLFPALVQADCQQTSPVDRFYNCIGFAAEPERRMWWWPFHQPNTYWPQGAPHALTLEAYEAAFATRGYRRCDSETLEEGVEKIAIFVDARRTPTHAARQLEDGLWTSKLGRLEDIRHPLRQVEGVQYGRVALVMARPRVSLAPVPLPPRAS